MFWKRNAFFFLLEEVDIFLDILVVEKLLKMSER